jgi:hypothetical protein
VGGDTGSPPADAADSTPEAAVTPDLPIDRPPDPPPPVDMAPPPVDMAPASTLNMGLVGRWKLDEGSGTAAADSAGGDNNGTITGATWVMPGHPGARYPNTAALRFDGNDHVQIAPANMPANNRPQTVALWINYSAVPPAANGQIAVVINDGMSGGARLKVGFKSAQLAAFKGGSDPTLVSAAPPAAGWHHLAYTYDGTTHRLYVDGAQRDTSTVAPNTGAAANVRMGSNFDGSEPFTGVLDEVRIYNRALTAAEVASLQAGNE